MDSWYVETLLRHRDEIKASIYSDIVLYEPDEFGYEVDLNDYDFNNLLLIEQTLKNLVQNNQLSAKEIIIVNSILSYKSLSQLEKETGMSRITISKIFSKICDRISYILGEEFTDAGYLNYMQNKYKLTEAQVEVAKKYMDSNKRHFMIKLPRRNTS